MFNKDINYGAEYQIPGAKSVDVTNPMSECAAQDFPDQTYSEALLQERPLGTEGDFYVGGRSCEQVLFSVLNNFSSIMYFSE